MGLYAKLLWKRFVALSRRKKILLAVFASLLVWYLFSLPRTLFDSPYSTLVSDRNGELLGARIASDGQWRFPPADSVPEKYATCLTRFEDRYFRYHPGVNPVALGRAMAPLPVRGNSLRKPADRAYWGKRNG